MRGFAGQADRGGSMGKRSERIALFFGRVRGALGCKSLRGGSVGGLWEVRLEAASSACEVGQIIGRRDHGYSISDFHWKVLQVSCYKPCAGCVREG